MVIETLALTIVAYIAANVATGFLEEPGKELYQKVKGLFTPDEIIKLNLLEQVPDSPKLQGEVTAALDAHLKANSDVAAQLEELIKRLEELEKNKPGAKNVSTITNTDITDSTITNNVNQS